MFSISFLRCFCEIFIRYFPFENISTIKQIKLILSITFSTKTLQLQVQRCSLSILLAVLLVEHSVMQIGLIAGKPISTSVPFKFFRRMYKYAPRPPSLACRLFAQMSIPDALLSKSYWNSSPKCFMYNILSKLETKLLLILCRHHTSINKWKPTTYIHIKPEFESTDGNISSGDSNLRRAFH